MRQSKEEVKLWKEGFVKKIGFKQWVSEWVRELFTDEQSGAVALTRCCSVTIMPRQNSKLQQSMHYTSCDVQVWCSLLKMLKLELSTFWLLDIQFGCCTHHHKSSENVFCAVLCFCVSRNGMSWVHGSLWWCRPFPCHWGICNGMEYPKILSRPPPHRSWSLWPSVVLSRFACIKIRDVNTRVRWIPRPEPSIPGPDRDPKGPKQTHLRRVG